MKRTCIGFWKLSEETLCKLGKKGRSAMILEKIRLAYNKQGEKCLLLLGVGERVCPKRKVPTSTSILIGDKSGELVNWGDQRLIQSRRKKPDAAKRWKGKIPSSEKNSESPVVGYKFLKEGGRGKCP